MELSSPFLILSYQQTSADRAAGAFPSDQRQTQGRNGMSRQRRTNVNRDGRQSRYENSYNLADNEVLVQGSSLKTRTYRESN